MVGVEYASVDKDCTAMENGDIRGIANSIPWIRTSNALTGDTSSPFRSARYQSFQLDRHRLIVRWPAFSTTRVFATSACPLFGSHASTK
jgi:hypothetical protein